MLQFKEFTADVKVNNKSDRLSIRTLEYYLAKMDRMLTKQ